MEEFFTWQYIATLGGATVLTTLVTQFVKKISWLQKIPTQVIAYLIAVIAMETANYFLNGLDLQTALLTLLNAVLVATSANGTYDNLTQLLKK